MQFWTCSPGIFCKKKKKKKRCRPPLCYALINRWYASSLFAHALARRGGKRFNRFSNIVPKNRWNSARSLQPLQNAWNPVNVLNRSGAGGEFRSWARQKNVNFWSAAARRVCESRVLNSLSSRPSFKSAWNSRGGRGGGRFDRRTIHDKLVSRLEESLVNSSHPENCFQMLYRVQYTGCPKNVGTNWRRSWYNFLMEKKYSLEEWLWKEGFVSEKFE